MQFLSEITNSKNPDISTNIKNPHGKKLWSKKKKRTNPGKNKTYGSPNSAPPVRLH